MKVDITKLIINSVNSIKLNEDVLIPDELIVNSLIDKLENVKFIGKISNNLDNELELSGNITGVMGLKDDLTLEPVDYNFNGEVFEILENNMNVIDITDILWQNILVEIPSKVRKNLEEIEMKGNGWRVISEDEFELEMNKKNNPFANLGELLNIKEEE